MLACNNIKKTFQKIITDKFNFELKRSILRMNGVKRNSTKDFFCLVTIIEKDKASEGCHDTRHNDTQHNNRNTTLCRLTSVLTVVSPSFTSLLFCYSSLCWVSLFYCLADCCCAGCCLSVVMLNVIMSSVVLLSVVAPFEMQKEQQSSLSSDELRPDYFSAYSIALHFTFCLDFYFHFWADICKTSYDPLTIVIVTVTS